MKVKAGGFYYVVSRTLGFEFGGALGLVLFLSISGGIAFYCIGLGEVVVNLPGMPDWLTPRMIAVPVILLLFGFAWAGADVATKLQYVVMVIVFASILAIGWGGVVGFQADRAATNMGELYASNGGNLGFWAAFALFFPAITGFTQGLNMSGDLGRPTRAIPLGTFAAVVLSYALYIGLAVLMAGNATAEALRADYLILEEIAPFGWIVTAGVMAATASSAMASFLGAPRIAQALGRDKVFPLSDRFAHGVGPSDNPRRAVLLSGAIALGTVAIGNLNVLAPIITMFFLASYALLNYATFYIAHSESPSFRPTFQVFHRYISLAGGLTCLAAMIAIDIVASIVAVLLMVVIHQYLRSRGNLADWADSKRAFGFQRVREQLFEIAERPAHPRDWRPQVLIFSRDEERRHELLDFAAWIEGHSGLSSLVSVIEEERVDKRDAAKVKRDLERSIDEAEAEAFSLVVSAADFRTGFANLLQAYGVGPLKGNTVLVNWLEPWSREDDDGSKQVYGRNLELAIDQGFNVVVLSAQPGAVSEIREKPTDEPRIDIWWSGGPTGDFMLLLGYLVTRVEPWTYARLRLLTEARQDRPDRTRAKLEAMLEAVHIEAEVETIDRIDESVICNASANTALTFFPCVIDNQRFEAGFELDITKLSEGLPLVVFCIAGEAIDLAPDPDEVDETEDR